MTDRLPDKVSDDRTEEPEQLTGEFDDPKEIHRIFKNLKYTESCYEREDRSLVLPKLHVMNSYYFDIYGVDTIWHNMYLGPNSDWTTLRAQYNTTIEQLIQLVAKHIADGLYGIISMNATKHSLTVICGCQKMRDEMPKDIFDDPVDLKTFDWKRE